ncbi:MAG: branched-chain amino acid transport system ATP-binding protein [Betaproteobacteria bacterium]|jgi:branched-chain amino acid transport system ATP-binding protein|nr:branched-chain amino acid transport system ATP-binding protein [Betaproteobacteria bacterium]
MTHALSAQGLNKHFDGVVAAENVSLAVAAGERVGLIGSNGAGKTTFVNMITGYLKPDSGRIEIEGADITGLGPRQIMRRGVARSFQMPQLYPDLTVLDNMLAATACGDGSLSFWRPAHDARNLALARSILERFSLVPHAERRVAELPGGVRKLLDIAMALTQRPSLLLLDEPTSGVSVDEKFPVMDTVMAALKGERTTILFVEHDMEIVQRYASRVVAFYSGRVLADGAPATVLADVEVRRHVTGAEA